MRNAASVALWILFVVSSAAAQQSERKTEGVGEWRAMAAAVTDNGCDREWRCVAAESIPLKENEEIAYTPISNSRGECKDASCRLCAAPPPPKVCSWRIVEKP